MDWSEAVAAFQRRDYPFPLITDGNYISALIADMDGILADLTGRRRLILPELRRSRLFVTTDIGGETGSAYKTYSAFATTSAVWEPFSAAITEVRKQHSLPLTRRFHFKKRKRGGRQRAIAALAEAIGRIPGLVLTVAVSNQVRTLYGKEHVREAMERIGQPDLKPSVFERLATLSHITAYLVASLVGDDKGVTWYADRDSVFQKPELRQIALSTFLETADLLHGNPVGQVGFATEFDENDSKVDLDSLLAIPDLFAGAIAKALTAKAQGQDLSDAASEPGLRILQLLSGQGAGLKHITFAIEAGQPRFRTHLATVRDETGGLKSFPTKPESHAGRASPFVRGSRSLHDVAAAADRNS